MGAKIRLINITNGSSSNCICVGSDNAHILVDTGISNKRIEQRLNEISIRSGELDGIAVTREHSDHTEGFSMLARKHDIPIYSTRETLEEIRRMKYLEGYPGELLKPIHPDVDFMIGDMEVKPFHIDHDAVSPMAYRIQCERKSVAVATDIGHFDQYIVDHLQGLDAILLESNHDVSILETDPHPHCLKRRILDDHGYLSNENAGGLLNHILHDNLKNTLLGHLGRENNYEELTYETMKLEIEQRNHGYHSTNFSIAVAKQDFMSGIITV